MREIEVVSVRVNLVGTALSTASTVSPDLTPTERVGVLRHAAREALRQLRTAERDAGVVSVNALTLDHS